MLVPLQSQLSNDTTEAESISESDDAMKIDWL